MILGNIFGIITGNYHLQYHTWAPNRHLGARISILIDFRDDLGTLLGGTLESFFRLFCNLRCQTGRQLQVHLFDDLQVEILPEIAVCGKTNIKALLFERFHLFH